MHKLALALLAAIATSPAFAGGRPDLVAKSLADPARQHVPTEVLVQFKAGATVAGKARALAKVQGRVAETVIDQNARRDGKGELQLVTLPPGLSVKAALEKLGADPDVDFVEPNWVYQHQATSNDTYFSNGSLWGMYGSGTSPANQFGSNAATAWAADHTDCTGDPSKTVYVGIIDEGVMITHPDLAANIGKNPGEVASDRVDNDGNGLVDDVYGWDFVGNDNTVFDGAGDDHGTHVAGTIGGVGSNGAGVAGVCWTVRIMDAKFLGSTGGTTANAVKAVNYFTALKTRATNPVNIVATNNSWGGGGFSQALADAITGAGNANILFVAAAGNDGLNIDASPHYPAGYSNANIIAVAALTNTGTLASYSNYGQTNVDLGAPGSGILSTVPVKSGRNIVGSYASYSGTSMATPHVTGAVALYASRNPTATAAEIKAAILGAVTATTSLSGKAATGGRLNVGGF